MEIIILAGGLGMRLRSICADRPKPMVTVQGKPFLEHLLEYWKQQGAFHFILSVGYLHQIVINYFGTKYQGIPIDYAIENSPLGTGGALLYSIDYLHNPESTFLVLNGDTFFNVPLPTFVHKGDITLALYKIESNTRYHGVTLDESYKIQNIGAVNSNLINGGCYLFHKRSLNGFQTKEPISLEKEIVPILVNQGRCYGQIFDGLFIDIGIPEDYERSYLLL
ncbi:MAG TPA: sugar phosphate nucleotidyltransferase [Rhabdochlamydiaceae bacterium]|jgi:D-glycero-alpha-D-manno-heptose 1-phosphate guanylyltransferase